MKYKVTIETEVEADSEEDAIDITKDAMLDGFVFDWANDLKLVCGDKTDVIKGYS